MKKQNFLEALESFIFLGSPGALCYFILFFAWVGGGIQNQEVKRHDLWVCCFKVIVVITVSSTY